MSTKQKKVLFLTNTIMHYRIPIFNLIAEQFDFTVMYSTEVREELLDQCNFKTKYLAVKNKWKFKKHQDNIFDIAQNYDIVIVLADISWIDYATLAIKKKRDFKLLFWGIGVPASYHRKYGDASKLHYWFYKFFYTKADSLIFYSSYPFKLYESWGMSKKNLFAAHNTVEIKKTTSNLHAKKDLLFIGTLYKEKGITLLLDEYLKAYGENKNIPILKIVGGGDAYELIEHWIKGNDLEHKVHLLGPIYDEDKKTEIFSNSIACISPTQAGLSVLESMGYGVPFITMNDAITGGESFNISNNENGLLLEDVNNLHKVILDIYDSPDKYLEMGKNAYNHYWNYRKPSDMAQGVIDALNNVANN